jgi:hypothetical protein
MRHRCGLDKEGNRFGWLPTFLVDFSKLSQSERSKLVITSVSC